jgi:hypothetical protein
MTTFRAAIALLAAIATIGCGASPELKTESAAFAASVVADTMGSAPASVRTIALQARPELEENSGVTSSTRQPGIIFTINDSGNDPLLFAFDSGGADRGVWRVTGARNVDWEAISVGPCGPRPADAAAVPSPSAPDACLYLGDVGDNDAQRPTRVIYRVSEPTAERAGYVGTVTAEALTYRYPDRPHDVEAMYIAPNGSTFLITKRRLTAPDRRLRPSLVFELEASAWGNGAAPAVAERVDSLSIVPGSAPRRQVTDAALSPDGRLLAVRTYTQLFVFATDSVTGRVAGAIRPSVCNLASLGRLPGEGVAWSGRSGKLLLTSEGRRSPMFMVECPVPKTNP